VTPYRPGPIVLAVIGAAFASVCLTIASYAPWRTLLPAGLAAGFAEVVLIGLGWAGFGQVVATGVAAVGVGLFATLLSIRRQAPALVTSTAGITPMLPGMAVFRAVYFFAVEDRFGDGLAQLLAAGATALALGAGVVLGEFIGSPLRYRAGRVGDFFRIEGPPGLRRAVGRVVRLRPAEDAPITGPLRRPIESVALEPEPTPSTTGDESEDTPRQDGGG